MKKKSVIKTVSVLLVSLATAFLIVGCSNKKTDNKTNNTKSEKVSAYKDKVYKLTATKTAKFTDKKGTVIDTVKKGQVIYLTANKSVIKYKNNKPTVRTKDFVFNNDQILSVLPMRFSKDNSKDNSDKGTYATHTPVNINLINFKVSAPQEKGLHTLTKKNNVFVPMNIQH